METLRQRFLFDTYSDILILNGIKPMKGASAVNFIIAELLVFRCGVKDSSKNLQTHINEI